MAKGKKTGGRRPGSPNKMTTALKDTILGALSATGGEAYLVEVSKTNPAAFLSLVGKVLPLQVKTGGDDPQVPKVVHNYHGVTK